MIVMDEQTAKQLCANAIGEQVMLYLDTLMEGEVAALAESQALSLINQIREILDDQNLDDPTCFQRIDAIVSAWHEAGLETDRHWESE